MKIELEVDIPDGWEATGEYRWAHKSLDEAYLSASNGLQIRESTGYDVIILRRKRREWWVNVYDCGLVKPANCFNSKADAENDDTTYKVDTVHVREVLEDD